MAKFDIHLLLGHIEISVQSGLLDCSLGWLVGYLGTLSHHFFEHIGQNTLPKSLAKDYRVAIKRCLKSALTHSHRPVSLRVQALSTPKLQVDRFVFLIEFDFG